MLITLLKWKCVRKSKVLKLKGSKCSSWNKITTTLNESNNYCIFDRISSLKVHELNLYLVEARELYIWHYIIIKGYICIASSILSGMEKETPLREELQLQAQKMMKRKGL